MMTRKDEILDALIDAKRRRDAVRQEWKNRNVEFSLVEEQKQALDLKLKQLQAQITGVAQEWHKLSIDKQRLEGLGRDCSQEVSDLERELSRIIDAERVKAALLSKAKEFKESCLEAAWRAENRTDGIGAKSYQIDGAVHLAVAQRGMLGDYMGLGKSLTALIYCDMLNAQKVIIVCPSDTMHNFRREVQLWTPHRFPIVLGQIPPLERDFILESLPQSEHFMLIVNYEAWRKDDKLIEQLRSLKADTVIIDESHNIMHGDTGAAQGVHQLVFANNYCPQCYDPVVKKAPGINRAKCQCGHEDAKWNFSTVKRVVPISGTGIMNRPQDLWAQLHIVDPENFPDEKSYLRDFCRQNPYTGKWEWGYGGESRLVKQIGPRFLCRTPEDVGIEMPPLKPVEHLITQDIFKSTYPDQYKAYEQARDYAQILLDPSRKLAMSMPNKITALLRLRQVLVWPNAIKLSVENEEESFTAELNVFESVKVDKAEEIIKSFIESNQRIVVFSQFVDGIEELKRRLGLRAVLYYGKTTPKLKQAIQLDLDVKTAPSNPRWDVVLAHYKSGGVGLNFSGASHVIFLDPPWNPGTEDQAAGRVRRLDSIADNIHVHHIRVERTVDTWMAGIISDKKAIINGFEVQSDIYRKAYDALENGEM